MSENKIAVDSLSLPNQPEISLESEDHGSCLDGNLASEELNNDVPIGTSGISSNEVYPDAVVNIVTENVSLFQLKRKYDKEPSLIKLDPDFQRRFNWDEKRQSELIESILMGIPLPLIYVKEDDMGVYIVVDGLQRLTTMFRFLDNEFPLQKLKVLTDLNGAYFCKNSGCDIKNKKFLEQFQQSKIEDCQLTLQVIKPPTNDRITFDLFDRVNRGGTRLNNQEMRNAIYQGAATKLLNELADLDGFKNATENSIIANRMKDKYYILRLVAFYLWRQGKLLAVNDDKRSLVQYRSDLEDFLGKTMTFLNDDSSESFRNSFPELFNKVMKACCSVLKKGCFRLPKKPTGKSRSPISMVLFETVGYLMFAVFSLLPEKKTLIKKKYDELLKNEKFIFSTTSAVNANVNVHKRFDIVEQVIKEIKNAR